ncbi:YihA family ribosome biogenesis GTP-binding protein [Verticiella sediminum]|uniref:Probable GTP-binding protein EngB n=1 Tax=Verticiella sediminum TaxID=1247510 RepID=A0A556AMR7_9BURK|nr:ribosome biogenesis GTP-binding protein YihA/YsxC [Verticiella sediminum]TSH94180.1 YihA family ribosome biogenesis GTP-binding protein [Verticiella sediminum]
MSLLTRARFFVSAARLDQLPPPGAPEVCFVGRSNSGKSSAINVLAGQKRLAFSSRTPGRTRLINLFSLPDPIDPEQALGFLVDLPGYGYAEVAHKEMAHWGDVLGRYLRERSALAAVVLMLDIRRGLTEQDRNLVHWIAPTQRPVLVLLTKADKLPYGQRMRAVAAIRKELDELGTLRVIPFSATHRIGIEEATTSIETWISPQVAP